MPVKSNDNKSIMPKLAQKRDCDVSNRLKISIKVQKLFSRGLHLVDLHTQRIFSIQNKLFLDYQNPVSRQTHDNISFSPNLHNTTTVDSYLKQRTNLKRKLLFNFAIIIRGNILFCINERKREKDLKLRQKNKSGMIFELVHAKGDKTKRSADERVIERRVTHRSQRQIVRGCR